METMQSTFDSAAYAQHLEDVALATTLASLYPYQNKHTVNGHTISIQCVHSGIRSTMNKYQGVVDGERVYGPYTPYPATAFLDAIRHAKTTTQS